MKLRNPQLPLRLNASGDDPFAAAAWFDGMTCAYLGELLILRLSARHKGPTLDGGVLHLPLPPDASPRQIQDLAEAWLRSQALLHLGQLIAEEAATANREAPPLRLSFAAKSGWVAIDAGQMRCNWRLIQQSPATIRHLVARSVRSLPDPRAIGDLFVLG